MKHDLSILCEMTSGELFTGTKHIYDNSHRCTAQWLHERRFRRFLFRRRSDRKSFVLGKTVLKSPNHINDSLIITKVLSARAQSSLYGNLRDNASYNECTRKFKYRNEL